MPLAMAIANTTLLLLRRPPEVHFARRKSTIVHAGNADGRPCLYIRRPLRPRECVEHEGSVIVFGNVERDCTIRAADGDIIVLGHLLGKCHAGASESVVFALRMEPCELKIGSSVMSPCKRTPLASPEIASALWGMISFSPADKFYGNQEEAGWLKHASKSAKAALFTGAYVFLAGIAFLAFPKTLFGLLFNLENAVAGWIQAGAVLGVVFGVYYIGTALGDIYRGNGAFAFYLSTVVGRVFLFCSFFWLVLSGAAPSPLLLIGSVNLAGALWMLHALRKH